ncbi:MAG: phospholipase/carboxylesterase [Ktedonobacterales bacterium]|jgi:predicted esterase|nr:MAG: phospholipase/carboxylesterase [Ktedonobacterales bacterium]
MTKHSSAFDGPHQGQPVLAAGEPLSHASAAMVLVHGRGATAEDILFFAGELALPGFAYLAPQAAGNTWYPNSFLASIPSNEPGLSSGLALIDAVLAEITSAGIPSEHTIILGFSQGACLALEYVARHAQHYGGVVGWSGGLIGPDDTPRDYAGSLAGTPVFLGCSNVDPHIPQGRVNLTAEVLQRMGGKVTERIYPNMAHTVNQDEIAFVQAMMAALSPSGS